MINLNIYEFFNSQDVAEHCKKLGCSFTGRELAYMIWQSDHHTLQEKIGAWKTLQNTLPDEEHPDLQLAEGHGLHHFLDRYIERLEAFISDFQTPAGNWVYSYEKLRQDAPDHYLDGSPLYESYESCLAAALEEGDEKVLSLRIRKRKIHSRPAERMGDPMLYLTPEGQMMDLAVAPYYGEEDLLVAPFGFYGWFVEVPTPFQRGDIVTAVDLWGQRTGPMVVVELPTESEDDDPDMCAKLWEMGHRGQLRCNEDACYLSLAYYRGALDGPQRFLWGLHNYCKGDLALEALLPSYEVMLLEVLAQQRIGPFEWTEGTRHLAGLGQTEV